MRETPREQPPDIARATLTAEIYAHGRRDLEAHLRTRKRVEGVLGLGLPVIVGLALLGVLFSGTAPAAIEGSGAATSTTLVVSALLILGPALLFALSPDSYAKYETRQQDHLQQLLTAAEAGSDQSQPDRDAANDEG